MAKYDVVHACGHAATHQLVGKTSERDRKIAWLETTDCSDCWKAAQQAKRDADNALALETNKTAGLPALAGSEKQIVWAEKLRKTILDDAEEINASLATNPEGRDAQWPTRIFPEFVTWLRAQTSAKYWIDNRELSIPDTLNMVKRTGNPIPGIMSIFTGRGAASTASDHFLLWARNNKAPELAAYQAEQQAAYEARQAELARQAEIKAQQEADALAATLAPLAEMPLNPQTTTFEGNGIIIRHGGHVVEVSRHDTFDKTDCRLYALDRDEMVARKRYGNPTIQAFEARVNEYIAPLLKTKAATFLVVDAPDGVVREKYGQLTIRSTDGRIAQGTAEDGEWMIYAIGDISVSSRSPEMERIQHEARAIWDKHHTAQSAPVAA